MTQLVNTALTDAYPHQVIQYIYKPTLGDHSSFMGFPGWGDFEQSEHPEEFHLQRTDGTNYPKIRPQKLYFVHSTEYTEWGNSTAKRFDQCSPHINIEPRVNDKSAFHGPNMASKYLNIAVGIKAMNYKSIDIHYAGR